MTALALKDANDRGDAILTMRPGGRVVHARTGIAPGALASAVPGAVRRASTDAAIRAR